MHAPRLHPLRRPGRRRRRRRHRRDGPPGTRGAGRHPHQPARRRRSAIAGQLPAETERGTRGARRARHVPGDRLRLLPRAGHAAADDRLRAAGLTRRPGGLDARPRHRQLLQDLRAPSSTGKPSGNLTRDHILDNITLYWLTGTGASAARSYWESGQAAGAGGRPGSAAGHRSRSASPRSPARSSGRPRSWVETGLPDAQLLQRGRQGRPLRRLGGAGALHRGDAGRVQDAPVSLFGLRSHAGPAPLPSEGRLPGFDGATGWLNSPPLTPEDLRGKVVLVDFWTYTCINWLRTLAVRPRVGREVRGPGPRRRRRPHAGVPVRARRRQRPPGGRGDGRRVPGRARQRLRGLAGVRQPLLARRLHRRRGRADPAPPLRRGRLRRVREGRPAAAPRGRRGGRRRRARLGRAATGFEAQADWANLESPETYLGYEQAQSFASPGAALDEPRTYVAPDRCGSTSGRSRATGRSSAARACSTGRTGGSRSASTPATSTS